MGLKLGGYLNIRLFPLYPPLPQPSALIPLETTKLIHSVQLSQARHSQSVTRRSHFDYHHSAEVTNHFP